MHVDKDKDQKELTFKKRTKPVEMLCVNEPLTIKTNPRPLTGAKCDTEMCKRREKCEKSVIECIHSVD